jgi:hypothetical protein
MRLYVFACDQMVIFLVILDTSNGPKSFHIMVTNCNDQIQFIKHFKSFKPFKWQEMGASHSAQNPLPLHVMR